MMYVEFIERDRHMPIEVFRHLGNQSSAWAEEAGDQLLLQLGRTLRFGPHPSYLAFWQVPNLRRLDDWEAYFHSSSATSNTRSQAMHRAIHIQRAGLYEILHQADDLQAPLYAMEYLEPRDFTDQLQAQNTRSFGDARSLLLLERRGKLGPAPSLLHLWGAPSYEALEPMLQDRDHGGCHLVDFGVYRVFGLEIL
jgi:hypothetical protein